MELVQLGMTEDIIKGIYLLILMIISGITSGTFSKQGTKYLQTSSMAQHILILFIIYFTIDYSGSKNRHPKETLFITFIIWIFYILMSKQNIYFTICLFIQITILYILYDFSRYYKDMYDKTHDYSYKTAIKDIDTYINYISILTIITLVVGVITYYKYQHNIRKQKFSTKKFFLGSRV